MSNHESSHFPMPHADFQHFNALDLRIGRIQDAQPFPEARKPAIKLWIDFGPELGIKKSSAQLTQRYTPETLIGRQVVAVVNFAPRQIGPFLSEVLVLGAVGDGGDVVLLQPDQVVPEGWQVG
jgi:tRNA-binding protein